jgi:predicted transposase/invertase (TIGR01784 family)
MEEGIQQGIEKGIEQGIEQQKIKIAKSLLDILDDETIAEKTGLTINQIKTL